MRIECGTRGSHHYQIAGIEVVADSPWEEFAPFRGALSVTASEARRIPTNSTPEIRRTRGALAGLEREVTATWHANTVELQCEGAHAELVFGDEEITVLGSNIQPLDRELIAGPGLLLALTAAGRVTLHASAAVVGSKTLLFAGHSGAGKSTLARAFAADSTADDLVAVDTEGWRHWSHLPQRKWSVDRHCGLARTSGELVWIALQGDRGLESPALDELAPAEALKGWIAHTAAARLYSEGWQRAWLDRCARAAQAIPAFRLRVPWAGSDADLNAQCTASFLRRHFSALA